MADIYADLLKADFSDTPTNQLNDIINYADDSVTALMAGLQAIGSLAFRATESINYTESSMREDLRGIGELLTYLPRIIEARNDTAIYARQELNQRLKNNEVAND